MRLLVVNENIGGHVAAHLHLRGRSASGTTSHADFLHVPPPGLCHAASSAPASPASIASTST